jgi:hypothetical protein
VYQLTVYSISGTKTGTSLLSMAQSHTNLFFNIVLQQADFGEQTILFRVTGVFLLKKKPRSYNK